MPTDSLKLLPLIECDSFSDTETIEMCVQIFRLILSVNICKHDVKRKSENDKNENDDFCVFWH